MQPPTRSPNAPAPIVSAIVSSSPPNRSSRTPRRNRCIYLWRTSTGGTPVQLTFGTESIGDGSTLSWSPDGKTIALTLCRNAILNDQSYSHVALVDVTAEVCAPSPDARCGKAVRFSRPTVSHIAYAYSDGDPQVNLSQLYVTTPAGGPGHAISAPLDRNVGSAVLVDDSQSLVAIFPDRTTNALYRFRCTVRRSASTVRRDARYPRNHDGTADAPDLTSAIARDGTIAFVASSSGQPPELYATSPDGKVTRITDFNAALRPLHGARRNASRFRRLPA